MNLQRKLIAQLKHHEGQVLKKGRHMPYKCPADMLTIGYGRNLEERGISTEEAEFLLINDIQDVTQELKTQIKPWHSLKAERQAVLINMAFNLGVPRLMGFKNMLAALAAKNYPLAAAEMLNSKWARQVGKRAQELANQMETGRF